jgi:hypothetical protein
VVGGHPAGERKLQDILNNFWTLERRAHFREAPAPFRESGGKGKKTAMVEKLERKIGVTSKKNWCHFRFPAKKPENLKRHQFSPDTNFPQFSRQFSPAACRSSVGNGWPTTRFLAVVRNPG